MRSFAKNVYFEMFLDESQENYGSSEMIKEYFEGKKQIIDSVNEKDRLALEDAFDDVQAGAEALGFCRGFNYALEMFKTRKIDIK